MIRVLSTRTNHNAPLTLQRVARTFWMVAGSTHKMRGGGKVTVTAVTNCLGNTVAQCSDGLWRVADKSRADYGNLVGPREADSFSDGDILINKIYVDIEVE